MLRREVELRKSPLTLQKMMEAERKGDWLEVAEKVQEQVILQFTTSKFRPSLLDLRLAALRHPEIAFWVKYNRARRGDLQVGDTAPNVSVLKAVDGTPANLLDNIGDEDITVIVAGSLS